MFEIIRIYEPETKKSIVRGILEALPEWFGIAEAREEYIAQSAAEPFWCAYDGDKPIGFLFKHCAGLCIHVSPEHGNRGRSFGNGHRSGV